ncbi:MAG: ABC transporter permease [Pelagimonas sp.]|uniref:ABC transporter permease n=1 Tax=Pelagimonas sp. TaxID=2073170 RepID=UPI003D6C5D80
MTLFSVAMRSVLSRRLTTSLTVLAIALSFALVQVVDIVRSGARSSFTNTISQTDLIVGARTGNVQLLLYSVFHLGNAANNISWQSYQALSEHDAVEWIVPLSLGDSHKQYRVIGTTDEFFSRYRFAQDSHLSFASGKSFEELFDVVIGADVAQTLNYEIGTSLVIAHGLESFVAHDDLPFRVSGILQKTHTPVDRSVYVSLQALEAVHRDVSALRESLGDVVPAQHLFRKVDLTPKAITAALVGVKDKIQIFGLQRDINEYRPEPLTAIIPGVTLSELWRVTGLAEQALRLVAWAVLLAALLGMIATFVAGLTAREREFAILRTIGAAPQHVVILILVEVFFLVFIALIVSIILVGLILVGANPFLQDGFGVSLPPITGISEQWRTLLFFVVVAPLAALVPAYEAYRKTITSQLARKF